MEKAKIVSQEVATLEDLFCNSYYLVRCIRRPLFIWLNSSTYEKAFDILAILSVGIWISMIFSPLVNILVSKGDFKFLFYIAIVAFALDILLNLFFVPLLGGIGAAIAVIISIGFINVASFLKIRST
jgi:Na+-driven multidrug efflux pump